MWAAVVLAAVSGWLVVAVQSFHNISDPHWHPATATWYGDPNGDGSDGGACGYGSMVDVKPYRARVGAVSPILYLNGEGCGACYKVKCVDPDLCSDRPVTVIVTDQCPNGGVCANGRTHFDLSGAAFGHMAYPGHSNQLRDLGILHVLYRRTPCKYKGKDIAFHVNEGATDYWFSVLVEFEDDDGDIGSMHIRQAGSTEWLEMTHLWGANWCIIGGPLRGPFSIKLTSLSLGNTMSATDVIPRHWAPILLALTSLLNSSTRLLCICISFLNVSLFSPWGDETASLKIICATDVFMRFGLFRLIDAHPEVLRISFTPFFSFNCLDLL